MPNTTAWKSDNYKFVGKAFDYAYANRLNKLLAILGVASSNSIDYELTGSGDNGKFRPTRNPADNSNAANPLADLQYMVIGGGNDGFTAKQWAICDPALMREMVKLVYITRPTVMQTALDNPLKDLYTGYVDFGCGWGDGRQIIFSNPN